MGVIEHQVQTCYTEAPFPDRLRGLSEDQQRAIIDEYAYHIRQYFFYSGVSAVELEKVRSVLSAGCGTGEEAFALARIFPQATVRAVDLSAASLDIARAHLPILGDQRVTFEQLSILEDLPHRSERYDLVFSCGVIHHLEDPYQGFRILQEKVTTGGLLFIMLYHRVGFWREVLKNRFLDTVAGSHAEQRRLWARRMHFHGSDDHADFADRYIHPQTKLFDVRDMERWAGACNLDLIGCAPPLSLRTTIALWTSLLRYRPGRVSSTAGMESHAVRPPFSAIRVRFFHFLYFLLAIKGVFYAFRKTKEPV